nr:DUF6531 domain-containing protein [Myxococcota bacterium]
MTSRLCAFGPRFVGDPVDVVTGEVRDIARDFVIAGKRPLHFDRWYASLRAYDQDRGLGFGHRHTFDWFLRLDVDGMTLDAPDDPVGFPHLWTDGARARAEGWVLERRSSTLFVLKRSNEPERHFERANESARELRLTKLVHAGGGETRLSYETGTVAGTPRASRLVGVEDTDGWALRFEWGASHVRAVHAMGRPFAGGQATLIRYEHDAAGNLVRGIDAYNHTFTWTYDRWHRVLRRADRRGYAFVYSYDELGRCTRAAGEDGVDAVRLEHDEEALETRVVHEANGATFRYRYLPNGSLQDITDPYGAQRQFLYDDDGRLKAEVD